MTLAGNARDQGSIPNEALKFQPTDFGGQCEL